MRNAATSPPATHGRQAPKIQSVLRRRSAIATHTSSRTSANTKRPRASISQSRVGFATGLWGVHVLMALILVALFYRRVTVFSLFRLFR